MFAKEAKNTVAWTSKFKLKLGFNQAEHRPYVYPLNRLKFESAEEANRALLLCFLNLSYVRS